MDIKTAKEVVRIIRAMPYSKLTTMDVEGIDTILAHVAALEADLQAKGERVAMLENFVRSIIDARTADTGEPDRYILTDWDTYEVSFYLGSGGRVLATGTDCLDALDNMNAANTGEGEKDVK